MDKLPEDLKIEIFRRLGIYGFRYLAPFISSSKTTSNAVFSPRVLKSVCLAEFILETSMVNKDSPYRSFFSKCVLAENRTATELEGLRILCQEGPSETTFAMVNCGGPTSVFGIFVTGVFRICSRDYETGMGILQELRNHCYNLVEAVELGETVIDLIRQIGPAGLGLYFGTFPYPPQDAPPCIFVHGVYDHICDSCFDFVDPYVVHCMC